MIFEVMCEKTKQEVGKLFETVAHRFIPYVSMHEFEALLFSNSVILSNELKVQQTVIGDILRTYSDPEAINHETAPSKRHCVACSLAER